GGLQEAERLAMAGPARARTIRAFDAAITTPRWGYASVAGYYAAASPLTALIGGQPLPPTLLLHAVDDPWVPVEPLRQLAAILPGQPGEAGAGSDPAALPAAPRIVITPRGGHIGFHAPGDGPAASWADRLAVAWLGRLSRGEGAG
ncbi:MAG: alpha/beta hydrolase, partial [Cyanobium sp.]